LESVFNVALPPWQAETQRSFALEQCNKAIGLLRSTASHPLPIEVVLMSCILFVAFEYLDNRCENRIDLLRGGLEVVRQWRSSTLLSSKSQSEIDIVEDHLAPVFARCKLSVMEDPELEVASLKFIQGQKRELGNLH
jgi:hypothetical protein